MAIAWALQNTNIIFWHERRNKNKILVCRLYSLTAITMSVNKSFLQWLDTYWRWCHFLVASWQGLFPQCSWGRFSASICGPGTPSLFHYDRFSSISPSTGRSPGGCYDNFVFTRVMCGIQIKTKTKRNDVKMFRHMYNSIENQREIFWGEQLKRVENQVPVVFYALPHCGLILFPSLTLTWLCWWGGWRSFRKKVPWMTQNGQVEVCWRWQTCRTERKCLTDRWLYM